MMLLYPAARAHKVAESASFVSPPSLCLIHKLLLPQPSTNVCSLRKSSSLKCWAHDYFLVHLYGAAPGANNGATSKLSAAADRADGSLHRVLHRRGALKK